MQKFSDSSRMKSQKLMKTSLKRNVKKISIGAVLLAVGFSSYAVIASDDSMVSSKGKGVSIAAAGNTLQQLWELHIWLDLRLATMTVWMRSRATGRPTEDLSRG